jgi:hypothetical protein
MNVEIFSFIVANLASPNFKIYPLNIQGCFSQELPQNCPY